ncbi:MAG TPA: DUF2905 domain-containing protein [Anseongella sp.]|nr:DUF2905 domain-containing protein [Anseongella sp.]
MKDIAKIIILAGGILLFAGLIMFFVGDKLKWFGHLPGDIRIEKPGFRLYAPLVSMLLVSIVLSLALWLVKKLF